MVDLEQLKTRGLRAYEAGRLRAASRIVVLLPVAMVCLLETKGRETCVGLVALLLVLSIWLRWRNRRGVEDLTAGLVAGSVPLATGLILARLDRLCSTAGVTSVCSVFCGVVGISAGVLLGVREARRRPKWGSWLTVATIATLVGCLGCVRLGVASIVSVAVGIAIGTAGMAAVTPRET
jgi:hypothetical protein